MNLPNKLTVFRIIITPFFLLFFFSHEWFGFSPYISLIVPWILWAIIELSDILDGYIARKYDLVTDLGKVMDPFADVLSRITYFICFAYSGIMPIWIFALILYRELGITFLRMVMIKNGIALAASIWGKLKAVFYALSGVVGLIVISMIRLDGFLEFQALVRNIGLVIFSLALISSLASFITYLIPIIRKLSASR